MNSHATNPEILRFRPSNADTYHAGAARRRALVAFSLLLAGTANATMFTLTSGYIQTFSDGVYPEPQDQDFVSINAAFLSNPNAFNQTIVNATSVPNSSASATVKLFSDSNGAYIDVLSTGSIGPAGFWLSANTSTSFGISISGPSPVPFSITGGFVGSTTGTLEAWNVSTAFNGSSYSEGLSAQTGSLLGPMLATWNGVQDGTETFVAGSSSGILAPGTYFFSTYSGYWQNLQPHAGGKSSDYTFSSRLTLGSVAEAAAVPEPATTAALTAAGLLAFAAVRCQRSKA